MLGTDGIQAAEIVVPCPDVGPMLGFFTKELGFRLDSIFPADHPEVATVSGHGARLRLDARATGAPAVLRVLCADPDAVAGGRRTVEAPNGMTVELAPLLEPVALPPVAQSLVVSRAEGGDWGVGRAGMRYRDLIPGRQGGRFIASHICIPDAGPVPDYVHFHRIRFQMIFCRRGWVRLAYEDQGEPFVLHAGDCVLQPPEIRHRVLESSGPLEVVEIGCPAEHETRVDHDLDLPTGVLRPERDFGGQRFVRHVAADAPWAPVRSGFEGRDTGIGAATGGLAGARVLRPSGPLAGATHRFDNEFHFLFALDGTAVLRLDGAPLELGPADAVVIPAGTTVALERATTDLELLEVSLPADMPTEVMP